MFTRWWYTSTSHPPSILRWNQHKFLLLPIFSPKHLGLCSCVISSHPYSFVHTNRRFIASPEKGCRACVTICMLNRTIKLLHLKFFHYLPFVWWVFSRLFSRLFFRLFLGLVHGWTSIFANFSLLLLMARGDLQWNGYRWSSANGNTVSYQLAASDKRPAANGGGGGAWGHRPALISIWVGDPLLCTLRYFNLRYRTRLPMRGLVLVALNASRNIH